ncbi:glycoside hydrolase family 97 catalytic domain-containing protein [Pedobacter sp. MC2016-05]|uniref:glycoside hydrolase family 97 protein n=1 Tax=Pedobacter sp. MC2016-05 TaxID=2994474 RepID=UPI002246B87C|nr:glycoside hydrolase family 97 protein [Pedobacter sp. MC2016-05]MCX2475320.1 glycoside hydrolase family 97 catalytic domain-containing protein [Pedobacter sp. MC2016-05]
MIKLKHIYSLLLPIVLLTNTLKAQQITLLSPDKKIKLSIDPRIFSGQILNCKVSYLQDAGYQVIIPRINLGLKAGSKLFYKNLKYTRADKQVLVQEDYRMPHGKRAHRKNSASERVLHFLTSDNIPFKVTLRAYNDGIAFRYHIDNKNDDTLKVTEEMTGFLVPESSDRWLQKFVSSYEGFYPLQDKIIQQGEWGYPGLFKIKNSGKDVWILCSEAGLDEHYCATKLSNVLDKNEYKLTFPSPTDGNGTGAVEPKIAGKWTSPWRALIVGSLKNITESTLIEDLSPATTIKDLSWIKPGVSSWVYWANNHGTMDYQKVVEYIDLAARMNWPYTLFDWEWDAMGNGGKLEDAVKYANGKGIRPLMWYNSGGPHNRVESTPRDKMLTHESRVNEFKWLKSIGVYGVKIDFFESDKQDMIKYYLDILKDAADYKLMVNFHGSTIPRGWSRTYPHLMSMEAVYGAEQYNNGSELTGKGAQHNATLPFTRNVIGPMDYTPVTFTNSQHPHQTSYAHELALSVIFESGIQHFADRPEGFDKLADEAKSLLRRVPASWDDTKFISGYPGQSAVIARRSGSSWYVAGINGTDKKDQLNVPFDFLKSNITYKSVLIADGTYDSAFKTTYQKISHSTRLALNCLPKGGFIMVLEELP